MKDNLVDSYVIMVFGPPGAGKSRLAESISKALSNAIVLSNDVIRNGLGYPVAGSEYTLRVYRYVAKKAYQALQDGFYVIVDATFYSRRYRSILLEKLKPLNPYYVLVKMETPIEVCRNRVLVRQEKGIGQGQDDVDRFDQLLQRTERWDESELPRRYGFVSVDGTSLNPKVLNYSESLPGNIIEIFRLVCEDKRS